MDIVFEEDKRCLRCWDKRPVINLRVFFETPRNDDDAYFCSTCMDILADELRKRSDAVAEDQARGKRGDS